MGDEASKLSYRTEASGYGMHGARGDFYYNYRSGLSPSVSSSLSSTPVRRGGKRTVFIFDWDDTLLCSTALRLGNPSADVLMQIEAGAESLLLTAMSLGETLIVTNGTESWVPESSARFLPGLQKTLRNVVTISARARHEHKYPEDPFAWKREAFTELLSDAGSEAASPGSLSGSDTGDINLVVVGDSWYEIEAAKSVMKTPFAPASIKTVKFKEMPSPHELLGQIRRCTQELSRVSSGFGNSSWSLSAKPLPAHMESLTSCSSAWDMTLDQDPDNYFPSQLLPPPTRVPTQSSTWSNNALGLQENLVPRDLLGRYGQGPAAWLPPPISVAPPAPLRGASDNLYLSEPRPCPWVH